LEECRSKSEKLKRDLLPKITKYSVDDGGKEQEQPVYRLKTQKKNKEKAGKIGG
jgi:hypothetical protein